MFQIRKGGEDLDQLVEPVSRSVDWEISIVLQRRVPPLVLQAPAAFCRKSVPDFSAVTSEKPSIPVEDLYTFEKSSITIEDI